MEVQGLYVSCKQLLQATLMLPVAVPVMPADTAKLPASLVSCAAACAFAELGQGAEAMAGRACGACGG